MDICSSLLAQSFYDNYGNKENVEPIGTIKLKMKKNLLKNFKIDVARTIDTTGPALPYILIHSAVI